MSVPQPLENGNVGWDLRWSCRPAGILTESLSGQKEPSKHKHPHHFYAIQGKKWCCSCFCFLAWERLITWIQISLFLLFGDCFGHSLLLWHLLNEQCETSTVLYLCIVLPHSLFFLPHRLMLSVNVIIHHVL